MDKLKELGLEYSKKITTNKKVMYYVLINKYNGRDELMKILNHAKEIQDALQDNEYIVVDIARVNPYKLSLTINKTRILLKLDYRSGNIKGVNMSIPISANALSSLKKIINALETSEIGKKLLETASEIAKNTEGDLL
jgi:hypothetical protein